MNRETLAGPIPAVRARPVVCTSLPPRALAVLRVLPLGTCTARGLLRGRQVSPWLPSRGLDVQEAWESAGKGARRAQRELNSTHTRRSDACFSASMCVQTEPQYSVLLVCQSEKDESCRAWRTSL